MSSDLAAIAGVEVPTRLAAARLGPGLEDGVEPGPLVSGIEYGLVSYLYSADLRRALQVAEAPEAGVVGISRGVVSDPAAPFGGVKQSGTGREGGHDGLLEFTETRYVAVDW